MFVPVVTKDMQLFPAGRQPAVPHRLKNVRSRAQTLEQFAQQKATNASQMQQQVPAKACPSVSASTASVAIARQRFIPNTAQRQRGAQSVGSLAMTGAHNGKNGKKGVSSRVNSIHLRMPQPSLDAIAEGVEMNSTSTSTTMTKKSDEGDDGLQMSSPLSPKSTPDLQNLKIQPSSPLSTSSSPGLDKTWQSPSAPQTSTSNNERGAKEKGKGVLKWLKNTLNGCGGGNGNSDGRNKSPSSVEGEGADEKYQEGDEENNIADDTARATSPSEERRKKKS